MRPVLMERRVEGQRKIRYKVICKECGEITWQPLKNARLPMFCNIYCYFLWLKKNQIKGKNHHSWKGEKASYSSKHKIIYRMFGKANKCENPKCLGQSKNYDWSNISGKYYRRRSDWKMLCKKCHMYLDHSKFCRNGHKRTKENTKLENGYRRCLDCRKV